MPVGPIRPFDQAIIRTAFRRHPLMAKVPRSTKDTIAQPALVRHLAQGEVLINEGEVPRRGVMELTAYLVLEGEIAIEDRGVVVSRLGSGALVGEGATLNLRPYRATARALSDAAVLGLTEVDLYRMCYEGNIMRPLKMVAEWLPKLRAWPIFHGWDYARLVSLLSIARLRTMRSGETLIREGEYANKIYLIVAGAAEITTQTSGSLTRLDAGTFMGVTTYFGDGIGRATVTLVATTGQELKVLEIAYSDLEDRLINDQELAALLRRLRDERQELLSGAGTRTPLASGAFEAVAASADLANYDDMVGNRFSQIRGAMRFPILACTASRSLGDQIVSDFQLFGEIYRPRGRNLLFDQARFSLSLTSSYLEALKVLREELPALLIIEDQAQLADLVKIAQGLPMCPNLLIIKTKGDESSLPFEELTAPHLVVVREQFAAQPRVVTIALEAILGVWMERANSLRDAWISILGEIRSFEAIDERTFQHIYRSAFWAVAIAEELGLSTAEVDLVEVFTPAHDVGKRSVALTILRKPDRLTARQMKQMSRHPEWGEQRLTQLLEGFFPDAARVIVRNHHERFDGQGYPDRLTGEQIPLLARIVAIADAFDAMSGARPYDPPRAPQDIYAEINRCSGTQFDPVVVAAFNRVFARAFPGLIPIQ